MDAGSLKCEIQFSCMISHWLLVDLPSRAAFEAFSVGKFSLQIRNHIFGTCLKNRTAYALLCMLCMYAGRRGGGEKKLSHFLAVLTSWSMDQWFGRERELAWGRILAIRGECQLGGDYTDPFNFELP